ncbi:MAG: hypothetical protein ACUVUB_03440 [Candidatus Bathyarchaeia archaeon]
MTPNEKPIECAVLELMEETGYTAEHIDELFNCYIASGLKMIGSRRGPEEHIQLEPVT